ncbi:MAG: DUF3598 family protein [Heteroscytonema crispum UTEX LB 1556]
MNLQEQHWKNLFGDLTTEGDSWYGIWTYYDLETLEVVNSFQGVRKFQANEDKTIVTHTNNYTYSDGREEEKSWQIEKQICNHLDGITHPASLSMRSFSLGEGANTWLSKKLQPGEKFGAELFFRYQDWRTSAVCIYGESGELEKIVQIREHLGSFPTIPAKPKLENLSGKWVGTKQSITPNLQISDAEEITKLALDLNKDNNENFFLPDGIVLNIPKKVKVGEAVELVAGKLVAENEYKRLTVKYDDSGDFALLISEVFRKED